ncbi:vegetative cell wall protein gp1 [Brachypodium distachyon]|uniref:Uncharacterized protein n=1 Tax=Brachypodium distachyon TaxID=15368 RepID=I1IAF7_BRADI|nr:vegetative cell wall protein gp1 [Brachypodium distachyon]KQJ99846.1 hypothetical protein BRADI_3g45570v3 [Brachypodium distachyon]|eukprot:XP_010235526.1 vegetative cell wall protein gp1 [Brachypodium distachyon]
MPTSSSPPAPATPAAAPSRRRRRRHRLLPSSSFSTAAPSPIISSFFPPSPSPFHRFLPSPLRASSVPFSWEHRPGIPKTPARSAARSSSKGGGGGGGKKPLPLPPSLLCRSGADPYDPSSVVPADYDCSFPPEKNRGRIRIRRRRTRVADALADWLSMLGLYRSCKRAASCFADKVKSP